MRSDAYRFEVLATLAGRREERAARRLAETLATATRIDREADRMESSAESVERSRWTVLDGAYAISSHAAASASRHAQRASAVATELRAYGRAARAEASRIRALACEERAALAEAIRDAQTQRRHRTSALERHRRDRRRRIEARDAELALDMWNVTRRSDAY